MVSLVVLAAVERKRKGRNLQRGEGGARGGYPYRQQGYEFAGMLGRSLSRRGGGCGGWKSSEERERREGDVNWKNWEGWFFGQPKPLIKLIWQI